VPTHAEDYVHRIGRTGRAGNKGHAYTIAMPGDRKYLDAIERVTGHAIPPLGKDAENHAGKVEESDTTEARGLTNAAPAKVETSDPVSTGSDASAPPKRRRRSRGGRNRNRQETGDGEIKSEREAKPEQAATPEREEKPKHEEKPKREEKPRHQARPNRSSENSGDNKPEAGLGDHMPAFLMREVKLKD